MEKIPSFTVNHLILVPGIYLSRIDEVAGEKVLTYDLRITTPNKEPVMNTAEVHTIEHLGATFLRNHEKHKDSIIYFGPMGCRTGFYLIVKDRIENKDLTSLLIETFRFISEYEGEIPGATPRDCGNYSDQSLSMAHYYAKKYLLVLESLTDFTLAYKE